MFENIKLYLKLASVSLKAQMQHRTSFFLVIIAYFLSTFIDIIGIWVLFDRFEMVKGWTLQELAIIYGIIHMGFATAEASARGFDKFSHLVITGDFDRVLLRPISTLLQVGTSHIQLMRIGRFLQGFVVLLWGCYQLNINFFSSHTLVMLFAFIGTASLFYGLLILQATLSFWTTETLELVNIATYGGLEAGQFPLSIYPSSFRLFFTFLIPLACVVYYPIAVLLNKETLPFEFGILLPLAGILFLYLSTLLWHIGVNRYQSAGN